VREHRERDARGEVHATVGASKPREREVAQRRVSEAEVALRVACWIGIFGLFMALTFTGAVSVAESGREQIRAMFVAAPAKYEPQYGGFCSNGAPYAVKLGSDPTEFEIRDGRLFIFGDVIGHEFWLLGERENIAHADALWPEIKDKGWRAQSIRAWTFKVPWYRTGASLMAEWREKHPGKSLTYDTGGAFDNLVFKYPGWRAREGFGQPRLGVPGEADDNLAR